MSLEAARELSIQDLIHVLNEKLDLEWSKLLNTPLPSVVSAASVKSEIKHLGTTARDILEAIPTLWNLAQSANRLPQELISRIARHLLLDENNIDARPVIPLTHVCRHWRESIVSTPGNWTLISNNRSELTALSLERAKAARLDVSVDMRQFRADPRSFGPIIPYTKNIDTLSIYDLPGIEELALVFPNFPQSTPNLRSLTLYSTYANAKWDRTVDPFKSFPRALKCLGLFDIPLYSSLRNLRALTDLTLRYLTFDGHVDTLLTFLEQNRSLERATLDVRFTEPSLRQSQRQAAIKNRLQHLSITCNNPMNAQVLIANIALRRGAHLEISSLDNNTRLSDVLSDIPTNHLSNLSSPDFLEYQSYPRIIQLRGRNGSFAYSCSPCSDASFIEFPSLPLADIREFRFEHRAPGRLRTSLSPPVFDPSFFPSLETLAIECDIEVLHFLSALLPSPSTLPSLKTLAFLNCVITEEFMEKLTKYACDRQGTALARLYQVVIVQKDGIFPSATLIHALGRHVPVVDVRFGTKFPTGLT